MLISYKSILKKILTKCFYNDCLKQTNNYSSWRNHFSLKHRFLNQKIFKENLFTAKDEAPVFQQNNDENINYNPIQALNEAMQEDNFEKCEDSIEEDEESSQKLLLSVYIQFKDKYLIAEFKKSQIFKDFEKIINKNNKILFKVFDKYLMQYCQNNVSNELKILHQQEKRKHSLNDETVFRGCKIQIIEVKQNRISAQFEFG